MREGQAVKMQYAVYCDNYLKDELNVSVFEDAI